MSGQSPHRTIYVRWRHPRYPQFTIDHLFVRPMAFILVILVKLCSHGRSLRLILCTEKLNQRINTRCLYHLVTLELAHNVPSQNTDIIHRKFLQKLHIINVSDVSLFFAATTRSNMRATSLSTTLWNMNGVGFTLLHVGFPQKLPAKPQIPVLTSLSGSVHRSLQQYDFAAHTSPLTGSLVYTTKTRTRAKMLVVAPKLEDVEVMKVAAGMPAVFTV